MYENISTHETFWMPEGQGIKGEVSFMPNDMCASMDTPTLSGLVAGNSRTEIVNLSSKLPEYTPPNNNAQRKGGGKSYGMSPDDRLLFIKKQLCSDMAASGFTTENSLPLLIKQVIAENPMDEDLVQIYFDTLIACTR